MGFEIGTGVSSKVAKQSKNINDKSQPNTTIDDK